VFGNSLIDHSTFETDFETFLIEHGINYTMFAKQHDTVGSNFIWINYENINLTHNLHKFKTLPLLLAVNSHKLNIHNSLLKKSAGNSVSIALQHAGYGVELYLTNITVVDGNREKHVWGDICIYA